MYPPFPPGPSSAVIEATEKASTVFALQTLVAIIIFPLWQRNAVHGNESGSILSRQAGSSACWLCSPVGHVWGQLSPLWPLEDPRTCWQYETLTRMATHLPRDYDPKGQRWWCQEPCGNIKHDALHTWLPSEWLLTSDRGTVTQRIEEERNLQKTWGQNNGGGKENAESDRTSYGAVLDNENGLPLWILCPPHPISLNRNVSLALQESWWAEAWQKFQPSRSPQEEMRIDLISQYFFSPVSPLQIETEWTAFKEPFYRQ